MVDRLFEGYSRTPKLNKKIIKAAEKHGEKSIPVHCELKILSYFVSKKHSQPPLGYIGVSKLPCMGCQCVFESWNQTHDRPKHFLKRSFGRWYYPWAIPGFPLGDPVTDAILDNVKAKVMIRLEHHELVGELSDSSVSSDSFEI